MTVRAATTLALLCMLFGVAVGWTAHRATGPRLVGLGCAQSAGPLYASEEDEFPPCRMIMPAD